MLGWGSADFLAALASRKLGNVLALFWMQVVGLSIALLYFVIHFSSLYINKTPQFGTVLLVVALLQTIAYLAFYKGLEKGQVSLVSPIGACWAMVTAILSVVFYNEQLKSNQIAAIVLIITGILLASVNLRELLSVKKVTILLPGVKEGLTAMFGWGISLFLIVPSTKALGWFLPIFVSRLFALVVLTTFMLYTKYTFKVKLQLSTLILLLPIGFLDIGAFFTYSFGVSGAYASVVASIASAFTMVTVLLAKIFLKEKIVLNQAVGIVGIIIGLVLIPL